MGPTNGQPKKFNDPLNTKIQKKFDQVFQLSESQPDIQETEIDLLEESLNFHSPSGETKMNQKNSKNEEELKIDFDFSDDKDEVSSDVIVKNSEVTEVTALSAPVGDGDLGFSIDFNFDDGILDATIETKAVATSEENSSNASLELGEVEGFTIENFDHEIQAVEDDRTRVTEAAFSLKDLDEANRELPVAKEISSEVVEDINFSTDESRDFDSAFNLDEIDTNSNASDLAPSLESVKTIESTILDIVKPDNDFLIESVDLDLTSEDEDATREVSIDKLTPSPMSSTNDTFFNAPEDNDILFSDPLARYDKVKVLPTVSPTISNISVREDLSQKDLSRASVTSLSSEESIRFQSTIRALREEREDFSNQIKLLKSEVKELNQDNLTLKANLDEAKIEITILRKRHLVEVEDIKYRLSVSEEKKLMAEEKARQSELKKEKLEQKVRIDFNQVKQREKELESKLELLSMDVDSQVHSRDQKILELRRKIDALEFNMENASIKEQKSLEDKRRLEDRLNKIMKTLRHSIKNLEDDITEVDQDENGKDKN